MNESKAIKFAENALTCCECGIMSEDKSKFKLIQKKPYPLWICKECANKEGKNP